MSVETLSAARAAQEAGRLEEADALYARAAQADPANPEVHHNRGGFLKLVGRLDEAEASLRRAHALAPDAPHIRHALGTVLLSQGRYAEGWPLYEARHDIPGLGIPKPALPYPQWRGEPLAGRKLLVWGEQGFGDQIMSARFAAAQAEAGAEVTLLCNPLLARLFQVLPVQVLPMSGPVDVPDPDAWAMSGDLAGCAGVTPLTIPAAPYLRGAPSRAGGIGVVARGNPRHVNDAHRSLPDRLAQRLLALPGAVSLDLADIGAADFQATADLIAGLDLVVCVDTAVAHLAGAMGKPVWILLSALMTDWRWGGSGETTPWYPTARLYRQAAPGDWAEVLDRVEAGLR